MPRPHIPAIFYANLGKPCLSHIKPMPRPPIPTIFYADFGTPCFSRIKPTMVLRILSSLLCFTPTLGNLVFLVLNPSMVLSSLPFYAELERVTVRRKVAEIGLF